MNDVVMLHDVEPKLVIEQLFERNIPLELSFLADGQWQIKRAVITDISDDLFSVRITPKRKNLSRNIKSRQAVGLSFKYGFSSEYDKFVFDTKVFCLEASQDGEIVLAMPDQIEIIPRRSFLRVPVPDSLNIDVQLWHRYCTSDDGEVTIAAGPAWDAKLLDISAGGMQVAIPAVPEPDFKKADFIGLKFTPLPDETPLMFNAQIKTILNTADGNSICFGLKMVGLEASPEGRLMLSRLVGVVQEYHSMNQKQKNLKKTE